MAAALSFRTLLILAKLELERLRSRYEIFALAQADRVDRRFAAFLSRREARTARALDRWFECEAHCCALDVHMRLAGGFPLTEKLRPPTEPRVDELLTAAEHSDAALEQLRDRIETYAASAELDPTFETLDALIRRRRRELAAARVPSVHTGVSPGLSACVGSSAPR
jgi:hypothetical protein